MLTAQKMDAVKDEVKSTKKPALNKNDNLNKIQLDLKEKIESIQQAFEKAWNKYPAERRLSQSAYTSQFGVESFLREFKNYQTIEQIQADFSSLRSFWLKQCEQNGVLVSYGECYLSSLHLMEALFICAFMDNLSFVLKATTEPALSVEVENKVNLEKAAEEVKNIYEQSLSDHLFKSESKKLIHEMLHDVVDLNHNINLYDERVKKILEVKPIEDKSVDDLAFNPVRQLLSDELTYASLTILDEIGVVKSTEKRLIESRNALLAKHNHQIDTFLTTVRAEVVPVQIDCDAIPELHQFSEAIASINEKNKLNSLESDAVLGLKQIILANKDLGGSLRDYVNARKPKFFTRDKEPLHIMWEMYDRLLNKLSSSPHMQKVNNFTLPEMIDVTDWISKKASIVEKLEIIKQKVLAIVNNKILSLDFQKIREEIITREGNKLRDQVSSYKEISSFQDGFLELRRAELDKQWEVVLANEDNVKKLKNVPKNLFEKSGTLIAGTTKDALMQTACLINQKLDALKKPQPPIPQDKPVPSNGSPTHGFEFVDKNMQVSPVAVVGSVQVADEIKLAPKDDTKPTSRRYSRFVDKPWKCALLTGLGVFVVVGLAATGIGVILEVTASTILLGALGIGGGFGLIMGGVTYAEASKGYHPPPKQAKPLVNHIAQPVDLIRSGVLCAPSVFPVCSPSSLTVQNPSSSSWGWFLRHRKSVGVAPPSLEVDKNKQFRK